MPRNCGGEISFASDAFPYRSPAGAVLDAGDYDAALTELLRIADYEGIATPARGCPPRREIVRDWICGRHRAVRLEHGLHLAGADARRIAVARIASRAPMRAPSFRWIPAARSPCACAARRTGRAMPPLPRRSSPTHSGFAPDDIDVVTDIDTLTSAWSIASGNYSNRFASIVVDAIAKSAEQVAHKVRLLAARSPGSVARRTSSCRMAMRACAASSNKGMPFRKVCRARALGSGRAAGRDHARDSRDRGRLARGARLSGRG